MDWPSKIIDRSIRIAYGYFKPTPYQKRYHFAFAYDGCKLVDFAKNDPIKTHSKAHMIGHKFSIPKFIEYPFLHAEVNLVCKLWQNDELNSSLNIVILRINRQGKILLSKPCSNCQIVLNKVGLKNIYWSENSGKFQSHDLNLINMAG